MTATGPVGIGFIGAGIVDLARSIRTGTSERATGAIASHVLDVLLAIRDSAASGDAVTVAGSITKPEPFNASFDRRRARCSPAPARLPHRNTPARHDHLS